MMIMVAAMLLLPAIDALAKVLAATVPVGLIAWSRFAFQTALLAPVRLETAQWLAARPVAGARGARRASGGNDIDVFRGRSGVAPGRCDLDFFVEPLILTLLSAVLLGESIGWRRLSAVAVGFLGALIIVRPSYEVFGVNALLPLASALCFALYLILTRRIAPHETPTTMQFHAGFFGFAVMSAGLAAGALFDIAALTPVWPEMREWILLAAVGLIATVGHQMVVHAFRRAEASILAPFQYLEIIAATLYGFILFGDFPDLTTWGGVAIIIGSGIYVFHRERTLARIELGQSRR